MRPMLQVRLLQQRLRTLSCQLAATKAAGNDAGEDTAPGEHITFHDHMLLLP